MGSRFHILFAATLAVCAQTPVSKADAATEARLRRDVAYLASPELKGRGNGSPELDRAARRAEGELKALGLRTRIQWFPFLVKVARAAQEATLVQGDSPRALVWGRDIEALGLSADADFRNKALAFIGYGVQVPGGYDDCAGIDLKGRVAVISRTVPELVALAHLPRIERTLPARLKKLEAAQVAGVIVLEEGGLQPLGLEEGQVQLRVPVVAMTLDSLAGACGDLAGRFKAIQDTGKPASRDFILAPWTALSLSLKLRRDEAQLPNVVAEIPGRDPKLRKECIALGAHLDHLGLGERHSKGGAAARGLVHPGADDNASGSALVVELARELKAAHPKRSILILLFGGEEEGRLGSQYWIQHPTRSLDSVKFMLNFDMVGHLDPKAPLLTLGGLGVPAETVAAAWRLAPKDFSLVDHGGTGMGDSDHLSFFRAKIPTFFFTGLHEEYHRPTDTADRINYPGLVRVASFSRTVALDLANAATLPAFDPGTAHLPLGAVTAQKGQP